MPHESPIPLIRLTHIIGGYSAAPIKTFEKGFEYTDDESGEKIRVRESDLTKDEIYLLSMEHYDSLTSVYIEKEEDPQRVQLQEAMLPVFRTTKKDQRKPARKEGEKRLLNQRTKLKTLPLR